MVQESIEIETEQRLKLVIKFIIYFNSYDSVIINNDCLSFFKTEF